MCDFASLGVTEKHLRCIAALYSTMIANQSVVSTVSPSNPNTPWMSRKKKMRAEKTQHTHTQKRDRKPIHPRWTGGRAVTRKATAGEAAAEEMHWVNCGHEVSCAERHSFQFRFSIDQQEKIKLGTSVDSGVFPIPASVVSEYFSPTADEERAIHQLQRELKETTAAAEKRKKRNEARQAVAQPARCSTATIPSCHHTGHDRATPNNRMSPPPSPSPDHLRSRPRRSTPWLPRRHQWPHPINNNNNLLTPLGPPDPHYHGRHQTSAPLSKRTRGHPGRRQPIRHLSNCPNPSPQRHGRRPCRIRES